MKGSKKKRAERQWQKKSWEREKEENIRADRQQEVKSRKAVETIQ